MIRNLPAILIFLFFGPTTFGQNYVEYKKLVDTTIQSKSLGFSKNITVTVPKTWQRNIDRSYPLIVIFDRQNSRSHKYILNTIDYITTNYQMPPCILVSVESDEDLRLWETLHSVSDKRGLEMENEKFLFE